MKGGSTMATTSIILIALLYLLCGLVYSLVYSLNYEISQDGSRQRGDIWVGITVIGWPVYILVDLVLGIIVFLGRISRTLLTKGIKANAKFTS
jgi:hypothetical protein